MQFANHTVTGPKSIANLHRSGSNLNDLSPLATFRAYDKLPNDEHVRKARGLPFFTIYKGDWTQPRDSDDTTARPVEAVCKMTYSPQLMARLREEAELYEKSLKELQGNVVPNFYGCYEGAIQVEERGVTPIVCIILSDCGEVVDVESLIKNDTLVNKVMQSLVDLHVIGKIYPQWTSYNFCTAILIQDDNVRLVGFSGCITGHVCNIDRTQFTQYALDFQSLDHFGCDDLYATAVELGWLTPGFIKGPLDVRVDVFPSTEAMLRELRKIYRSLDKAHFIKEGGTLLDAVETYRKEYGHRKEVVGRLIGAMYSWPPQENHTGWKDWDFSEEIAVSPELIGIDPDDEDETHLDSEFDKDIHEGLSLQ